MRAGGLVLFVLLAAAAVIDSTPVHEVNEDSQLAGVIEGNRNAVVQILVTKYEYNWQRPWERAANKEVSGSGFFTNIDDKAFIVTNAHVVENSVSVDVKFPDLGMETFKVTIVAVCHLKDVALLQLRSDELERLNGLLAKNKAELRFLELGDSDSFMQGSTAVAVGYPLGQANLKYSTGVLSGKEHVDSRFYLQVTAPINPGNSGGPLMTNTGEVMGINTCVITGAENVGYALPSNHFKALLVDFAKRAPPEALNSDNSESDAVIYTSPHLGIDLQEVTPSVARYLGSSQPGGILLIKVESRGLFHYAGAKVNDLLLDFDGHSLDRFGQTDDDVRMTVFDLAERMPIGSKLVLNVWRDGHRKTLSTTFEFDSPKHQYAIHACPEPLRQDVEWEIFGSMVFMELALNHLEALSGSSSLSSLSGDDEMDTPALIITAILNDQVLPKASVTPGTIVDTVNGKKVTCLSDYRAAFKPDGADDFWVLTSKSGELVVLEYSSTLKSEAGVGAQYNYEPTSAVASELRSIDKKAPNTNTGSSLRQTNRATAHRGDIVSITRASERENIEKLEQLGSRLDLMKKRILQRRHA